MEKTCFIKKDGKFYESEILSFTFTTELYSRYAKSADCVFRSFGVIKTDKGDYKIPDVNYCKGQDLVVFKSRTDVINDIPLTINKAQAFESFHTFIKKSNADVLASYGNSLKYTYYVWEDNKVVAKKDEYVISRFEYDFENGVWMPILKDGTKFHPVLPKGGYRTRGECENDNSPIFVMLER